jgi:hypothetical protein
MYWKRVLCLQSSAATTRLLRITGNSAELVIGYRLEPFFGHAWVECGGSVVNDSAAYKNALIPLLRV